MNKSKVLKNHIIKINKRKQMIENKKEEETKKELDSIEQKLDLVKQEPKPLTFEERYKMDLKTIINTTEKRIQSTKDQYKRVKIELDFYETLKSGKKKYYRVIHTKLSQEGEICKTRIYELCKMVEFYKLIYDDLH